MDFPKVMGSTDASHVAAWCILQLFRLSGAFNSIIYSVLEWICEFADTMLQEYISLLEDAITATKKRNIPKQTQKGKQNSYKEQHVAKKSKRKKPEVPCAQNSGGKLNEQCAGTSQHRMAKKQFQESGKQKELQSTLQISNTLAGVYLHDCNEAFNIIDAKKAIFSYDYPVNSNDNSTTYSANKIVDNVDAVFTKQLSEEVTGNEKILVKIIDSTVRENKQVRTDSQVFESSEAANNKVDVTHSNESETLALGNLEKESEKSTHEFSPRIVSEEIPAVYINRIDTDGEHGVEDNTSEKNDESSLQMNLRSEKADESSKDLPEIHIDKCISDKENQSVSISDMQSETFENKNSPNQSESEKVINPSLLLASDQVRITEDMNTLKDSTDSTAIKNSQSEIAGVTDTDICLVSSPLKRHGKSKRKRKKRSSKVTEIEETDGNNSDSDDPGSDDLSILESTSVAKMDVASVDLKHWQEIIYCTEDLKVDINLVKYINNHIRELRRHKNEPLCTVSHSDSSPESSPVKKPLKSKKRKPKKSVSPACKASKSKDSVAEIDKAEEDKINDSTQSSRSLTEITDETFHFIEPNTSISTNLDKEKEIIETCTTKDVNIEKLKDAILDVNIHSTEYSITPKTEQENVENKKLADSGTLTKSVDNVKTTNDKIDDSLATDRMAEHMKIADLHARGIEKLPVADPLVSYAAIAQKEEKTAEETAFKLSNREDLYEDFPLVQEEIWYKVARRKNRYYQEEKS